MTDDMQEIINDFVTEAEESLDRIDPLFVELETNGEDKEILNDIFRCMHTLKGAAGFLGFQPVVDVAHTSENILKRLREGEVVLTKRIVDAVLASVDTLRALIGHVKHGEGLDENIGPILAELDAALAEAGGSAPAPGAAPEAAPAAPAPEAASPAPVPQAVPEAATAAPAPAAAPSPAPQAAPEAAPVATAPAAPSAAPRAAAPEKPEKKEAERKDAQKKDEVSNLRVDIGRIDKVMDLTGEVVLARNRLLNLIATISAQYADDPAVANVMETVSFLDLVTSDLQLSVMKMRMQALQKVFGKFPRIVRDLAAGIGKEVDLKITGEETEVDRSVIEHIGDPLVHIIRNAIDHGLESPEARRAKGKPERGTVSISASQRGNQIVIEISDDGKGIDVDRVKRKAVDRGLVTADEAERMTEDAAINLIFQPGFSTMDVATELSGRGVGMDVVKTSISKLSGFVEIKTRKDEGSTFRINIPLTLAIIQALMVRTAGVQYAVPLSLIEEIVRVSPDEVALAGGRRVFVLREKVLPFFELSELLGKGSPPEGAVRYSVVVAVGDSRFCLAVDKLLGEEEVVIKPLDGIETDSSYTLGSTITGDGKVVLIMDLASISRSLTGSGRS
jgi:two-component system chemotaxis sensor kinase CheA